MSPNNEILFNGILRPKLHNNPFASCYFINFDFSLPDTAHFDDNVGMLFFVFNTFGSILSVSFSHFKQYVNMFYND